MMQLRARCRGGFETRRYDARNPAHFRMMRKW
jgi:hypothetical protein